MAFNISDHYQGKGIGSVLLEHLADIGRDDGLTSFEAEVLPQNHKMLAVFADAGYIVSRRVEDGVVQVHFDIEPTEKSESVRLSREHRAESISISALLAPKVIAVVGAGRTEGSVGHEVLRHLRDGGFTGQLYVVNPSADEVLGITSYPHRQRRSRRRSTSPWWRCPPIRRWVSSRTVRAPGSTGWSSSPPGLPRAARMGSDSRSGCCGWPATAACGSSARPPSV